MKHSSIERLNPKDIPIHRRRIAIPWVFRYVQTELDPLRMR